MNINNMNRDELKLELRDVHATNTAVMPKWREVLDRVFSGEEKLTMDQKADLLGLPTRRGFFRVGGTAVAGAVLLAACGDDGDDSATPSTAGGDTDGEGDGNLDLVLAQTAISLEILAIDTYQAAIDSGLVTTELVGTAAGMFQAHHVEHRGALEGVVNGAGATPVTEANAAIKALMVDPVLTDGSLDEAKIIALAYELESAAAQTYVYAATALSTPQLRSTIMTIGGVENRHATILNAAGNLGKASPAFLSSANPLPADALVGG